MSTAIEDYAVLSNCRSAALVSRDGSVDWLCLPRYDSASMFGALLGDESHGAWSLRPTDPDATVTRRYDDDTFVLVTRWETSTGVAEVHDAMPIDEGIEALVRRVVGISGEVDFVSEVRFRFDYARAVPWVRQVGQGHEHAILAVAGPDAVILRGPRLIAVDTAHRALWTTVAGESVDSVLSWGPSWRSAPAPIDVDATLKHTVEWWAAWARRVQAAGEHAELVTRSLLVLRALTHAETGGIVAAATTSLPESFGGERNWDYRYVWLRDAALTLSAYIDHGYLDAAHRWRTWLLRAIAGDPADVQIMYGIAGERDLPEREITSLPGYDGAQPVRIGNGAVDQYQADVIGEVMVALEAARDAGVEETSFSWALQRALLDQLAQWFDRPDNGIWEMRGDPHFFTHSRAMVWAAFDRGIRAVEQNGLDGEVDTWREMRDRVQADIDAHGVHAGGWFTQHADTDEVDASLLILPQVGFCAYDDPRMLATVERMEQTLMPDGWLLRYRTTGVDGLAGDEYPFLACSFWLVGQYAHTGRRDDAVALMRRLTAVANDVGLLSEEYDPRGKRQAGNTPQALSHLALVGAADALGATAS
ncbi:glycoside hydrolase family 15 protein [Microbacterium sp. 1P10AE]|uniref:glycoside hydrolase family 15 protein n=1 Tax=Microbacterium sp. 1P10AE TaxID=3132286 RepID=UPI0039A234A7